MSASGGSAEAAWRPLLILSAAFVASWGALLAFPALRTVLFMTFFGLVLAAMLSYPIDLLDRWLPRGVSTAVVALLALGVGVGTVALAVPMVVEQAQQLAARAPSAIARLQRWWRSIAGTELIPGLSVPSDPQQLLDWLHLRFGRIAAGVLPVAMGALGAVGHAVPTVMLAFFLALSPGTYERGVLAVVPPTKVEIVREVLSAMRSALRGWVLGTLLAMATVGTLTAIGLLIIGIDGWLALAAIAFVAEFVPYLGPIAAAIPAVLAGLSQSPADAVWVALLYLIVQQAEANLLHPLVMRWAVRLAPGLLIVWQVGLFGAFGLAGLLIATPLLAALHAGIRRGYIEGTLGKSSS